MDELGLSFQQALADLTGRAITHATTHREMSHFPTSPADSRDQDLILQYLEDRGISQSIVRRAQCAGFLRFVDYSGVPAAAFCGLGDNGRLRSMTLRLVRPIQSWDGQKEITKLDIRHSDKSFPALLRGGDPNLPGDKSVWVVEGGTDALAVMDWYRSHQIAAPDIIVSGGDGVRSFLDRPHVQALLTRASSVYVSLENEKDQKTQIKTDASHQRQIEKIQSLGCDVVAWRPPFGSKDIADAWKAKVLPNAHDPLAPMLLSGEGVDAGTTPQRTSTPTPDAAIMTLA